MEIDPVDSNHDEGKIRSECKKLKLSFLLEI